MGLIEREHLGNICLMVGRDAFIVTYMLTNKVRGTLYTGVTSRLLKRMYQHRDEVFEGFTKTYGLKRLVWYQPHDTITAAIRQEKTIKGWRRQWKINLIERDNPHWDDLYDQMINWTPVSPQL